METPPENPYVAYNTQIDINKNIDTNIKIIENKLCRIAQMDAWHDHHVIEGLSNETIKDLVNEYINDGKKCEKPSSNEDAFMYNNLITDDKNTNYTKYCRVQNTDEMNSYQNLKKVSNTEGLYIEGLYEFKPDTISTIFKPIVSERYNVIYCNTDNETRKYSLIQEALKSQGITDDYFLIKDTAKSKYSYDLTQTKGNQTVTNLLTAPGIYDPGPTTHPFTSTGIEQGFTDINSNSKFGIINFGKSNDSVIHYPAWKNDSKNLTKYEPVERLIFSKYDCIMMATTEGTSKDTKKYITDTNSTFYIKDNKGVFYVNKKNSDKATDLTELAFGEKFEKISSHRFPTGTQFPFPEASNITTISGSKKLFSKKVGDTGQALYTLRPTIYYKEYNPNSKSLIDKKTNGIHGFVSFDRVAIVSAIFYGAPIVIYICDKGFVIYISNNLINKLSNPLTKFKKLYDEYNSKKEKTSDLIENSSTIITDTINKLKSLFEKYMENRKLFIDFVKELSSDFENNIKEINRSNERVSRKPSKYDKEYKLWLSKLYIYNQYANSIGILYKKYDDIDYEKLNMDFNNKIEQLVDLQDFDDIDQKYTKIIDKYETNNEFDETQFEKETIEIQKNLERDVKLYNNLLSSFKKIQLIIDELENIDDVYSDNTSKTPFNMIQKLKSNASDEKKLNKFIKDKNNQIASSISNINISQGFQNPSCLTNVFKMFGSNKMPHFGPFYEICHFYQYLQNFDNTFIINGIIDSYKEFFENIKEISSESLLNTQISILYNDLISNDNNKVEIKNLSTTTIKKLQDCYKDVLKRPTITMSGGSKRKRHSSHSSHSSTKKIKNSYKNRPMNDPNIDTMKNYMEFNSLVSILQLFNLELNNTSVNNDFFDNYKCINNITKLLSKDLLSNGCNYYIDDSIPFYRDNRHELTKLQKMIFDKTKNNSVDEYTEITDYNLFINNIVGIFNQKLFAYICIFLWLNRLSIHYIDEYKYITKNTDILLELNNLKQYIEKRYKSNVKKGLRGYKNFIELFQNNFYKNENMYTEQYNIEFKYLEYSVEKAKAKAKDMDINEIFIDYLDNYSRDSESPSIKTQSKMSISEDKHLLPSKSYASPTNKPPLSPQPYTSPTNTYHISKREPTFEPHKKVVNLQNTLRKKQLRMNSNNLRRSNSMSSSRSSNSGNHQITKKRRNNNPNIIPKTPPIQ